MRKQTTRYSIRTDYRHTKRTHSLQFFYSPGERPELPRLDRGKISHAKKTLAHCRKKYPKWKHEIIKVVTIVEALNY